MLFIQGVYREEIPVYSQGTRILQENSKRRIMVYANGEMYYFCLFLFIPAMVLYVFSALKFKKENAHAGKND